MSILAIDGKRGAARLGRAPPALAPRYPLSRADRRGAGQRGTVREFANRSETCRREWHTSICHSTHLRRIVTWQSPITHLRSASATSPRSRSAKRSSRRKRPRAWKRPPPMSSLPLRKAPRPWREVAFPSAVISLVHQLGEPRPAELDRRLAVAAEPRERATADDQRADLFLVGEDLEVDRRARLRQLVDMDTGANRVLSPGTFRSRHGAFLGSCPALRGPLPR